MRKYFHLCALLLLAIPCSGVANETSLGPAKTSSGLFPTDVHRIVFLGDSITYSGQYVEYIEAYFRTRHPGRNMMFLNLGLPSETVSGLSEPEHMKHGFPRPDLHERLDRVLTQTKPNLVFACYGMNDGIYKPLDEERFKKFQEGILRLRSATQNAGAEIIHVTPPVYDEATGGKRGYSTVLDRYSEWLVAQRTNGWRVVNVHEPMKAALAERRAKDSAFAFARDGVHIGEEGHWLLAQQILSCLGAKDVASATNAAGMIGPRGDELLKLIRREHDFLKNAWLSATGHKRPLMQAGLPLTEAREQVAEIEKQMRQLLP